MCLRTYRITRILNFICISRNLDDECMCKKAICKAFRSIWVGKRENIFIHSVHYNRDVNPSILKHFYAVQNSMQKSEINCKIQKSQSRNQKSRVIWNLIHYFQKCCTPLNITIAMLISGNDLIHKSCDDLSPLWQCSASTLGCDLSLFSLCMENRYSIQGCLEINTTLSFASCCIYLSTHTLKLYFLYTL